MLVAGGGHSQRKLLRFADRLNADDLFTELAGRALLGQQGRQRGLEVACSNRFFKLHTLGGKGRRAGPAQAGGRSRHQCAAWCVAAEMFVGVAQACAFREHGCEMLNRGVDDTLLISQRKFSAFVERHLQRLVGLETAMRQHHGFKVGLEFRVCRQRRIKAPPDQCFCLRIVFQ